MKKNILSMIAISLLCITPAFAIFAVGTVQTFDQGLTGWRTSGDVRGVGLNGEGFAELAKLGTNRDNKLWTYFVVPTTGEYSMSFDYKFTGVDNFAPADDIASAGIGQGKDTLHTVFQATSSANLTGSQSEAGAWHSIASQPLTLVAGQKYWLGFELNESSLSRHNQLITNLDIDKVLLTQIRIIPAPGAILLSSIGAGLVGWLRNRRALQ